MKKVTTVIMALTMFMLFALMSSCSETPLPTENTFQSENIPISYSPRESLYKPGLGECRGLSTVLLYADQDILIGEVSICNDDEIIFVTYEITKPGWCLTETHSVVGTHGSDPDPEWPGKSTNKQGNPSPGQFPCSEKHVCMTEYTCEIPIPDGVNPLDPVAIAAHAKVQKTVTPAPYYASSVVDYLRGLLKNGDPVKTERSTPENGLAFETGKDETNFFSLGFGGWIIVEFDCPIVNGDGNDVKVIEDTWGTYPLETANVYASQDGLIWELLGEADNTTRYLAIHTITEFDLGILEWAKYIKVVDTSDPGDHGSTADGYDLNAVESLQDCVEEESAWGDALLGTRFVTKGNWATWFDYIVCNTIVEGDLQLTYNTCGTDPSTALNANPVFTVNSCPDDGAYYGDFGWSRDMCYPKLDAWFHMPIDQVLDNRLTNGYIYFSGIVDNGIKNGETHPEIGDRFCLKVKDGEPDYFGYVWHVSASPDVLAGLTYNGSKPIVGGDIIFY